MSETHSLRLEINAAAAKRGANEFVGAVNKIERAVQNLDRSAGTAFGNIQKNVGKVNFNQIAQAISRINSLRINPALVNNLKNLSSAMGSMRPVPSGAISSIRALSSALSALSAASSSIRSINSLASALNNIKAPPAGAAAGINLIAQAVRNLRVPQNAGAIVTSLTNITTAANATFAALSRLGSLNVTVRNPRVTGGGGSGLINPATGRAYGGVAPGYGFGAGRSAASGLRGFENVGNLSYQAGSAVRTAVGGLTAGAFLGQMVEATRSLDSFRAAMTSVGVSAEDTERMIELVATNATTLGNNLRETQTQFAQFAAGAVSAGVSVNDTMSMFDNFSRGMRASGLQSGQQQGALRALTQMFGKDRIMREEAVGQMADHWPAFLRFLADFMYPQIEGSRRISQLLEDLGKNSLDPRVLIPVSELIRERTAPAVAQQTQTLGASIERLKSNWELLMQSLGEGAAGKALTETFERFSRILQDPAFRNFMTTVGQGLANVLNSIGDAAEFAARNVDLVKYAFAALLAIGAGNLFIGIARAAANLVTPFAAVARWLGLIGGGTQVASTAFGRLGATIGGVVTTAFRALGAAITPVMAFFLTNPFGIFITALGLVATGLYLFRDTLVEIGGKTAEIRDIVRVIFEDIKNVFTRITGAMSAAWTGFTEFVSSSLRSLLTPIQNVGEALRTAFDPDTFAGKIMAFLAGLGPAIANVLRQIPGSASAGDEFGLAPTPDSVLVRPGQPSTRPPRYIDRVMRDAQELTLRRRAEAAAGMNAPDGPAAGGMGSAGQPLPVPPIPPGGNRRGQPDPNNPSSYLRGNPNGGGRGGEQVENYFARLDPGYGVLERLQDGERMLEEARRRGIGTAEDRVRWEGMIRDSVFESLGALDPAAAATRKYEGAMRALDQIERSFPQRANEVAAARRRITMATEEARNPIQFMIDRMDEETRLLTERNGVYEDEVALLRIRNQLRQQGIDLQGEEADRVRNSIAAQRRANQAYKDSQEGMASWANSFRDFGTELRKLEEKFLNQFADALTELVMTGKADWRSLAASIVTDINQLIIKQGIRELLKALGLIDGNTTDGFKNQGSGLLGGIFGGSGNNSGGGNSGGRGLLGEVTRGLFGGGNSHNYLSSKSIPSNFDLNNSGLSLKSDFMGDTAGSMVSGGGSSWLSGIGSWIGSLFAAEGFMPGARNNISSMMPATAFVNAPHFAEGTPNTSRGGAMPAILHDNEAVIPLTRGRKVPIEGGGRSSNVVFNITTPDADSFRKSQGQILTQYGRQMAVITRRGG